MTTRGNFPGSYPDVRIELGDGVFGFDNLAGKTTDSIGAFPASLSFGSSHDGGYWCFIDPNHGNIVGDHFLGVGTGEHSGVQEFPPFMF